MICVRCFHEKRKTSTDPLVLIVICFARDTYDDEPQGEGHTEVLIIMSLAGVGYDLQLY